MNQHSARALLNPAVSLVLGLVLVLLTVLLLPACSHAYNTPPILNQGKPPANRAFAEDSILPPLQVQSADERFADNPDNSAAVFFLIDESGGMSGEYVEDGVVVVDSQGVRYQIVHFFLTLMGVYHSEITKNHNLQMGVGRFADHHVLLLPIAPADSLFNHPDWKNTVTVLSSSTSSGLDPRYTNLPEALDAAEKALNQADVKERILILITDGSFRSAPIFPVGPNETHAEVLRNKTGEKLEELAKAGIRIYVFLVGQSQCRNCNEPCTLPACKWDKTTCENRERDLSFWKTHWEGLQQWIHILDERNPVTALMQIQELQPFLPSSFPSITSGWAGPDGKVTVTVHQYASKVVFWFFYVHQRPAASLRMIDKKDVTDEDYKLYWVYNVFQRRKEYPEIPPPNSCGEVPWNWEVGQNQQVFYIVQESIPSLRIDYQLPREILLNARDSQNPQVTIPISVTGESERDFYLGNCYQMELSVTGKEGEQLATPRSIPISPFYLWDLQLPYGLPPQDITIHAKLVLSSTDRRVLDSKQDTVPAIYKPELMSVKVVNMNEDSGVDVQVFIRYGNQNYVPGFQPGFYPQCEPLSTPAGKCYNPDKGIPLQSTHGPGDCPEVEVYALTIPYKHYWEPGCGCRTLRIVWNEFESICDLNRDQRLCISPTPAPTPYISPPPTSAPNEEPLCLSALLLNISSLIILMACKLAGRSVSEDHAR